MQVRISDESLVLSQVIEKGGDVKTDFESTLPAALSVSRVDATSHALGYNGCFVHSLALL